MRHFVTMKLFALGIALITLTGCSKTAEVAQTKAGDAPQVVATTQDAVPEPPKKVEEPPKVVLPPVVIASGTRVRVRTSNTISTKSAIAQEAIIATSLSLPPTEIIVC